MPTAQKRHTCYKCGVKRVEKYMHIQTARFSHSVISHWYCNDCSFDANAPHLFNSKGVRIASDTLTPPVKLALK